MDILSIFRTSPEKRIKKLRKKVKEPHGDASVREGAALSLFEMGTEPALRALLDRYTISVSPSVQDEKEKSEVFRWLIQLGSKAVPPIINFLKNERAVYWPARALKEILEPADQTRIFGEILRFHWENPPASAYPKAQIIRALEDVEGLETEIGLFLDDDDDDVLLAAVEYLTHCSEEEHRDAVIKCYLDAEDRPRVRNQILELLTRIGWTVRGFRPAVEETLPEGFVLTREGKIRKVGGG
jgi:HEAT repeat protein